MSPGAIAQVSHEISELGYKEPLDFDHDWILSEDQASSADHFFLRLGGDEFIRLHSDAVIAKFEEFPQASNSCGA